MNRAGRFTGSALPGGAVGVLALISTINALSTSAYLPALPAVGADLSASATIVQLTLTCYLIGTGIGQLTWGPLSDALGRRRPLLVGLACYIAASVLCALAPGWSWLLVCRVAQGWAACAGTVLSRSVVADHAAGTRLARQLTVLLLLGALAPVVAPLIGAWLLLAGSWRTVFLFLAATGVPMLAGAWWVVAESLPPARRRRLSVGAVAGAAAGLLRNRRFTGYAVALASGFATMFAFMSAAPFLFQDHLGLSAQQYGWVNAGVAGCLGVSMGLVGRHLKRAEKRGVANPAATARAGIAALCAATGGVVVAAVVDAPLVAWILVLSVMAASLALVGGSTMSLALDQARDTIGTGTALIGLGQAILGAIAAPLAGLGGAHSSLPMAITMACAAGLSALAFLVASTGTG